MPPSAGHTLSRVGAMGMDGIAKVFYVLQPLLQFLSRPIRPRGFSCASKDRQGLGGGWGWHGGLESALWGEAADQIESTRDKQSFVGN